MRTQHACYAVEHRRDIYWKLTLWPEKVPGEWSPSTRNLIAVAGNGGWKGTRQHGLERSIPKLWLNSSHRDPVALVH